MDLLGRDGLAKEKRDGGGEGMGSLSQWDCKYHSAAIAIMLFSISIMADLISSVTDSEETATITSDTPGHRG